MKASELISTLMAAGLSAEHAIIALGVAEDFAAAKCADMARANADAGAVAGAVGADAGADATPDIADMTEAEIEALPAAERRKVKESLRKRRARAQGVDRRNGATATAPATAPASAPTAPATAPVSPLMAAALAKAAPPRDINHPPLENLNLTAREAAPIGVSALPPIAEASPAESAEAEPENASRRKPERPLAADAEPGDRELAHGVKLGMTGEEIRREWERFRNHALQNDRRCRDWLAAWRNWLLNWSKRNAERSPPETAVTMPADYQPTAADFAYAEGCGMDKSAMRGVWKAWRDEMRGKNYRTADWGAAWRHRVNLWVKELERQSARASPRTDNGSIVQAVGELLAENKLKMEQQNEADRGTNKLDFSAGAIDLDRSQYRFDR